jgi:hypothetical protein
MSFEHIHRAARDAGISSAPDFQTLGTGKSYAISEFDAELLWDSFFESYFPEAKKTFANATESFEAYEARVAVIVAQNQAIRANRELPEDKQNLALLTAQIQDIPQDYRKYYKTIYNLFLQKLDTFLADTSNNTLTINGVNVKAHEYYAKLDAPVVNKTDKTSVRNKKKIEVWQAFLEKKTDILLRHKTIYIWVIFALVDMIKRIGETMFNRGTASLLYHQAQKEIVNSLKNETDKFQQETKEGIPIFVQHDEPISANAETALRVATLKAQERQISELAGSKQEELQGAQSSYNKQNKVILQLMDQLNSILSDVIN